MHLIDNEYGGKCIQWTMTTTANVFKEHWPRQSMYSLNNEYDNKCIQLTMNATANVFQERWPRKKKYSMNYEYDSKYIQGKWSCQQMYSRNNDHDNICIQWAMNMTANVFHEQQVAKWATIAHHGASIMFGDTIISDAQRQVILNLKQWPEINKKNKT